MRYFICSLFLAAVALGGFAEIGQGGTLTTNRPFCGS